MSAESVEIWPIGSVESQLRDIAAAPRQGDEGAPPAFIRLLPVYQAGASDLVVGDELVVLTWLHLADRAVLAVHPRDDLSRPLTGVFSTRSADRPNPIGLHRVTVRTIEAGLIEVDGLEAVDGTPVLDLKPMLAARPER